MISLIKSLLYILMDQHIFLWILRMIIVMIRGYIRGYKKYYNASLLIHIWDVSQENSDQTNHWLLFPLKISWISVQKPTN